MLFYIKHCHLFCLPALQTWTSLLMVQYLDYYVTLLILHYQKIYWLDSVRTFTYHTVPAQKRSSPIVLEKNIVVEAKKGMHEPFQYKSWQSGYITSRVSWLQSTVIHDTTWRSSACSIVKRPVSEGLWMVVQRSPSFQAMCKIGSYSKAQSSSICKDFTIEGY